MHAYLRMHTHACAPMQVLPAQKPRWAVSAWYHHDDQAAQVGAQGRGGDEEEGAVAGSTGGGMSEATFGNGVEEIESFLLALLAMKGDGESTRHAQPKAAHYRSNLRSW